MLQEWSTSKCCSGKVVENALLETYPMFDFVVNALASLQAGNDAEQLTIYISQLSLSQT